MRHLYGVSLAIVTAAALFFGGGWGVDRIMAATAHQANLLSITDLLAAAAVLGTGLLVGVLTAGPAFSPLGTGVPGLGLLAWSALLAVGTGRAERLVPMSGTQYAAGFSHLLSSGMLALLGMVMIIPLFVPSRWRRWREDHEAAAAFTDAEPETARLNG
jgi:hypothetical protein